MTAGTVEKRFPLLWPYRREERSAWEKLGCPLTVPWGLLAPHERQAQENHGQTLARLAERGGLSPSEMMCVLQDRKWRRDERNNLAAIPKLVDLVLAHERRPYAPPAVIDELVSERGKANGALEALQRLRASVDALLDTLPKCTIGVVDTHGAGVQCGRIATRAFERGSVRFCDECAAECLGETPPDYPRAPAIRDLLKERASR